MEKQNLFTEEELAKVTDEAERKHLIECAQDQSKIDSYIQGCWNVGGKSMSRPTKTCYDCKNACWDSVPYGSTTATMFGGCDKEDEMTEEEAERFGETEDCPFWENRYKEENA